MQKERKELFSIHGLRPAVSNGTITKGPPIPPEDGDRTSL
jgi:hypothetical protein